MNHRYIMWRGDYSKKRHTKPRINFSKLLRIAVFKQEKNRRFESGEFDIAEEGGAEL